MDDVLVRQLTRQLKILNRWLLFLATLVIVSLIVIGILLFKIITFVNDTKNRLDGLQQKADSTLNIRQRLCGDNKTSVVPVCEKQAD